MFQTVSLFYLWVFCEKNCFKKIRKMSVLESPINKVSPTILRSFLEYFFAEHLWLIAF